MKIMEKKKYIIEEERVKLFICDKCGKEGDEFSDIQTQYFSFGFGSKFDGLTVVFELCDDCVKEFIEKIGKEEELYKDF